MEEDGGPQQVKDLFLFWGLTESGGEEEGGYDGGLINNKLPGFCCAAFVRSCKSVDGTQLRMGGLLT